MRIKFSYSYKSFFYVYFKPIQFYFVHYWYHLPNLLG